MADIVAMLAGTWEGSGQGQYPTIESFTYHETVTLSPLPGKPILAYTQRTRSSEGKPLHAESGFYRFGGDGVELVVAQPTGIAETYRGTVADGRIELDQTGIALTPTAVQVEQVRRLIQVRGEIMTYRLDIATPGRPLLLHLEARLDRVGPA